MAGHTAMDLQGLLSTYVNYATVDPRRALLPFLSSNRRMTRAVNEQLGHEYASLSDRELAEVLAGAYRSSYGGGTVNEARDDGQRQTIRLVPHTAWREDAPAWYRDPLDDLRDAVEATIGGLLEAVILHGSLADHTAIRGWSDADIVLLFREGVLSDADAVHRLRTRLYRLRRYLHRIDPLQHHGFFVLGAEQLAAYPESILPLPTYRHGAVSLWGEETMDIRAVAVREEMVEKFKRMVDRIVAWRDTGDVPVDRYSWKLLLSQVMLLPALSLQAQGEYVYKGESFERCRDGFEGTWSAIEQASAIRREWPAPPRPLRGIGERLLHRYFFPGYPVHYQKARDRYLFRNRNHSTEQKRAFIMDAAALAGTMRERVGV